MKARTERGFTLVELMVVIVLIGLLVGVVGSQVWGVLAKGKNTTAENQIKEIETAVELFYLTRSRYPESLDELLENDPEHGFPSGYLKAKEIPQDPWGNGYIYMITGKMNWELISFGRDGKRGGEGPDQDINRAWK